MKRFELWLDESGDFDNDIEKSGKGANPSLVGGLLLETGSFPETSIQFVLPEEGTYHSVNEKDQLQRFRKIEEKLFRNDVNRMVVFSNQERIMILDNNLTYLNIISEGIFQLIKHLKALYGEVYLKVIIANRVNTTTGLNYAQSIVPQNEYEKRLKEKLLLLSLEDTISERDWELQTSSARKDKRLMLADIICNTFFTRYRKKKFNGAERQYIEDIYTNEKKTWIFTVFESILEKEFKNNLMNGRIGEAVSGICFSDNVEILERCFQLLKENFHLNGIYDIRLHYKFITAYIEYYINVVRDFDVCITFLSNLQTYYFPILRNSGNVEAIESEKKLQLDVNFYLMTVYTHLGNIEKSKELEEICEKAIELLPASMEGVTYRIKFEARKVITFINLFEFEKALLFANSLVEKCEEVKELLELFYPNSKTCYDELAKALGTRLQIQTFLLRENHSIYENALADSEKAIEEFDNLSDKKRQYLYRVQLETEQGNYNIALDFLKRSVALETTESMKNLWTAIEKESIFCLSAYIRLMTEGALTGWTGAKELFQVLSKSRILQELEEGKKHYHPVQLIFWKYATYCAYEGMVNASIKYYEKASEVCFASDDLTMNVIGMGIEFEKYSILLKNKSKEATTHCKLMKKRWNQVEKRDENQVLEHVFGQVNMDYVEAEYYWKLSRKITY